MVAGLYLIGWHAVLNVLHAADSCLRQQLEFGYSKRSLPTRHVFSSYNTHAPASSSSSRPVGIDLSLLAAVLGMMGHSGTSPHAEQQEQRSLAVSLCVCVGISAPRHFLRPCQAKRMFDSGSFLSSVSSSCSAAVLHSQSSCFLVIDSS